MPWLKIFKKVDEDDKETLEGAAEEALKQIKDKRYKQELIDRGIKPKKKTTTNIIIR